MADAAQSEDVAMTEPVESVETGDRNTEQHAENEGGADEVEAAEEEDDAEGEVEDEGEGDGDASDQDAGADNDEDTVEMTDVADGKVPNDLYKAYKAITEVLLNYKIKSKHSEEHFPSGLFKRLPNKRLLPEYYEVIKEPSAISTLRGKIQRKQYSGTPEFVRDFALISYNAQVFNRPNSQPVRDVLKLEEIFREELRKLVEAGLATEEEVKFPDLGEIPYSTPEPDPVSEDEEIDDADEDEEEDDDADDSDDDKRRRRGRKGARPTPGKKGDEEDDDDKAADAEQKRRGRPPKVATPMEHRIDRILKTLKKAKAQNGQHMIVPFERLPDKAEFPDYYEVIKQPMAFDMLKKKAKRKKYSSIDEFMQDVDLMFKNAMLYNEDGSDVHNWAQDLLAEAKRSEAEEKAKPDSDYLQAAEGRIPLPHILYKGDMWKVGDWIHIQNPNDITKPIVAQIYRTWKTANDEEWINACWYYRPEQTVHQYEKHFYANEVVKTGQYRDHKIEEVLNKCFVMFYTRYNRGRPRNLPTDTEVYVCEARYNEEKFKFNKIKTWASCLPDEVRDKDYEMDLFDAPRKIKKVQSPLLSRLKDDAKTTDELPQPEWKHTNAPPLVGGIHKRPRDENQSPPPEPTPPPQPAPPTVARTPSANQQINMRVPGYPPNTISDTNAQSMRATPTLTPQPPTNNNPIQYNRQNSYATTTPFTANTQNTAPQSVPQFQYATQPAQPTPLAAAHPTSYTAQTPTFNRSGPVNVPPTQYNAHPAPMAIQQRTAEAYVLSDAANLAIPKHVRDQFPTDDQGRVLFFTTPPLDSSHIVSGTSVNEQGRPLKHDEKFTRDLALRKRKHNESIDKDATDAQKSANAGFPPKKQAKDSLSSGVSRQSPDASRIEDIGRKSVSNLVDQMQNSTKKEYEARYGKGWEGMLAKDEQWATQRRQRELEQDSLATRKREALKAAHLGNLNGQYALSNQGYISGWQKNFFTGTYLDDTDSRLPF